MKIRVMSVSWQQIVAEPIFCPKFEVFEKSEFKKYILTFYVFFPSEMRSNLKRGFFICFFKESIVINFFTFNEDFLMTEFFILLNSLVGNSTK